MTLPHALNKPPATTLYGIPNCDTVKKSRAWLTEHGVDYTFHDFKKQGVPAAELAKWVAALGWEALVNKKGSTWRKLAAHDQTAVVDAASAQALMLRESSLIKRPVLDGGTPETSGPAEGPRISAGFAPEIWAIWAKL